MKNKLDLHGKKHNEVSNIIEDYILTTKTPFSIITGNSNTMKNITTNILDNYKFKWVIFSANLGEIIILE